MPKAQPWLVECIWPYGIHIVGVSLDAIIYLNKMILIS